MDKDRDKTIPYGETDQESSGQEEFGFSTTVEISRSSFSGDISTKQHAYLEIVGPDQNHELVELGDWEVTIGRSPECEIQLKVRNVSRTHMRVFLKSEEYHIEDLDSTNGVYVNGIRVMKCVLRNHDMIEIGGVKMIFYESMPIQKP